MYYFYFQLPTGEGNSSFPDYVYYHSYNNGVLIAEYTGYYHGYGEYGQLEEGYGIYSFDCVNFAPSLNDYVALTNGIYNSYDDCANNLISTTYDFDTMGGYLSDSSLLNDFTNYTTAASLYASSPGAGNLTLDLVYDGGIPDEMMTDDEDWDIDSDATLGGNFINIKFVGSTSGSINVTYEIPMSPDYTYTFYLKAYSEDGWDGVALCTEHPSGTGRIGNLSNLYSSDSFATGSGDTYSVTIHPSESTTYYAVYHRDGSGTNNGDTGYFAVDRETYVPSTTYVHTVTVYDGYGNLITDGTVYIYSAASGGSLLQEFDIDSDADAGGSIYYYETSATIVYASAASSGFVTSSRVAVGVNESKDIKLLHVGGGDLSMLDWKYGEPEAPDYSGLNESDGADVEFTYYDSEYQIITAPDQHTAPGRYYIKATFGETDYYAEYTTDYVSFNINDWIDSRDYNGSDSDWTVSFGMPDGTIIGADADSTLSYSASADHLYTYHYHYAYAGEYGTFSERRDDEVIISINDTTNYSISSSSGDGTLTHVISLSQPCTNDNYSPSGYWASVSASPNPMGGSNGSTSSYSASAGHDAYYYYAAVSDYVDITVVNASHTSTTDSTHVTCSRDGYRSSSTHSVSDGVTVSIDDTTNYSISSSTGSGTLKRITELSQPCTDDNYSPSGYWADISVSSNTIGYSNGSTVTYSASAGHSAYYYYAYVYDTVTITAKNNTSTSATDSVTVTSSKDGYRSGSTHTVFDGVTVSISNTSNYGINNSSGDGTLTHKCTLTGTIDSQNSSPDTYTVSLTTSSDTIGRTKDSYITYTVSAGHNAYDHYTSSSDSCTITATNNTSTSATDSATVSSSRSAYNTNYHSVTDGVTVSINNTTYFSIDNSTGSGKLTRIVALPEGTVSDNHSPSGYWASISPTSISLDQNVNSSASYTVSAGHVAYYYYAASSDSVTISAVNASSTSTSTSKTITSSWAAHTSSGTHSITDGTTVTISDTTNYSISSSSGNGTVSNKTAVSEGTLNTNNYSPYSYVATISGPGTINPTNDSTASYTVNTYHTAYKYYNSNSRSATITVTNSSSSSATATCAVTSTYAAHTNGTNTIYDTANISLSDSTNFSISPTSGTGNNLSVTLTKVGTISDGTRSDNHSPYGYWATISPTTISLDQNANSSANYTVSAGHYAYYWYADNSQSTVITVTNASNTSTTATKTVTSTNSAHASSSGHAYGTADGTTVTISDTTNYSISSSSGNGKVSNKTAVSEGDVDDYNNSPYNYAATISGSDTISYTDGSTASYTVNAYHTAYIHHKSKSRSATITVTNSSSSSATATCSVTSTYGAHNNGTNTIYDTANISLSDSTNFSISPTSGTGKSGGFSTTLTKVGTVPQGTLNSDNYSPYSYTASLSVSSNTIGYTNGSTITYTASASHSAYYYYNSNSQSVTITVTNASNTSTTATKSVSATYGAHTNGTHSGIADNVNVTINDTTNFSIDNPSGSGKLTKNGTVPQGSLNTDNYSPYDYKVSITPTTINLDQTSGSSADYTVSASHSAYYYYNSNSQSVTITATNASSSSATDSETVIATYAAHTNGTHSGIADGTTVSISDTTNYSISNPSGSGKVSNKTALASGGCTSTNYSPSNYTASLTVSSNSIGYTNGSTITYTASASHKAYDYYTSNSRSATITVKNASNTSTTATCTVTSTYAAYYNNYHTVNDTVTVSSTDTTNFTLGTTTGTGSFTGTLTKKGSVPQGTLNDSNHDPYGYAASCTYTNNLTAGGGSISSITPSASHTAYYYYNSNSQSTTLKATNGSSTSTTDSETVTATYAAHNNGTHTVTDTPTVSLVSQTFTPSGSSASTITRFTLENNSDGTKNINHSTMSTNVGTDKVTWRISNGSNASKDYSESVDNTYHWRTLTTGISSSNIPTDYVNQSDWIGAAGGTFTLSAYAYYWYDSEGEGDNHYSTVTSDTTFTIASNGFDCTISGNVVTVPSAGTTETSDRYSTYKAEWNGLSATRASGMQPNVKTLTDVYLSPYQPDSSWIVTVTNGNWNTCPAGGGYLKTRGYANYSYTSGSTLTDQKITDDASLTWSTGSGDWINTHSNGGYYVSSRGTTTGDARSSTGTWSYTEGSVTKTATKSFTQQANSLESVVVTVKDHSIDFGESTSTTSVIANYTSGSAPDVTDSATYSTDPVNIVTVS